MKQIKSILYIFLSIAYLLAYFLLTLGFLGFYFLATSIVYVLGNRTKIGKYLNNIVAKARNYLYNLNSQIRETIDKV